MKKPVLLFFLYLVVSFGGWAIFYFTGVNKLLIQSEDTIPSMFLPISMIKKQTLYLDDFYEMMVERYPHPDDKKKIIGLTPYYLKKVEGHYLSAFPIVSSVFAIPVYFIPVILGLDITWFNLALLAKLSAAVTVSLSAVFIYLIAKKFQAEKKALFLSLVYMFGTINLASISQALWQHGALELALILFIYFLFSKNFILAGFFLGVGVIARPTAILVPLIFSFYLYKKLGIKNLFVFAFGSLLPLIFFVYYNSLYYYSLSNQGYYSQMFEGWKLPLYKGFFGNLVSPSKGFLVYSPVLVFSLLGAFLVFRKSKNFKKELLFFKSSAILIFVHLIIISFWKHWYGGWSFGYRMLSDVLPFLCLLLIPYFSSTFYKKTFKLFLILFLFSFFVEIFGLAFFDGIWHSAYDKGFKDQSWLWSIKNSEVAFNLRRVLVKFNLLESPL